jgi:hypothetical protein
MLWIANQFNETTQNWRTHASNCAAIHFGYVSMCCAAVPGISMLGAIGAIRLRKQGSRPVAGFMT